MKKSSLFLILFFVFASTANAKISKAKKDQLKKQAIAKKPKPMFLMKKATEDLDVEEPKQDILHRQTTMVGLDERFENLD